MKDLGHLEMERIYGLFHFCRRPVMTFEHSISNEKFTLKYLEGDGLDKNGNKKLEYVFSFPNNIEGEYFKNIEIQTSYGSDYRNLLYTIKNILENDFLPI